MRHDRKLNNCSCFSQKKFVLPSINFDRPKACTAASLSLYNKLDRGSALELSRDTTIDGDPKAHQCTKGDLHDDISFDSMRLDRDAAT